MIGIQFGSRRDQKPSDIKYAPAVGIVPGKSIIIILRARIVSMSYRGRASSLCYPGFLFTKTRQPTKQRNLCV